MKDSPKMLGKKGEELACKYFCKLGFRVIEKNFRTRYGEVDLIACDGNYIVFVEVKSRTQGNGYLGLEAVDIRKQKKIIMAAKEYLSKVDDTFLQPRFDVIEVKWYPKTSTLKIAYHIKGAFEEEMEEPGFETF